tara:strand:- start:434 stop:817 length:384 start_codon:yes stop_codon:yes gene_type:complete
MRFIFFIIIFISCFQKSKTPTNVDLIGSWISDSIYTITFKPNGKFKILFNKNNAYKTFEGLYSVKNFGDIKIIDLKGIEKFNGPLYGVFKFIDFNTIRMSKFSNNIKTRPISFEKNNYYMIRRKLQK